MRSSRKLSGAPGLEVIPRPDGTARLLWRAPKWAQKAGYEIKSLRIDHDIDDPSQHDAIRSFCVRETNRVNDWRGEKARPVSKVETLKDLSRLYQTHEASPFHEIRESTRRTYTGELRLIERWIGGRTLSGITAADFRRWYKEAKASVEDGGDRKAHGVIKRLRSIISFGIAAEVAPCVRLKAILDEMTFAQPPKRKLFLTYDMVVAIIAKAHELKRPSIALAQALQFETGLRQVDVIGYWETCEPGDASPYRMGDKRWRGLVWQDIGPDLVLTVDTSKTGAVVSHDLSAMPLVKAEIDRIPIDRRIGAVVVMEGRNRPWHSQVFAREWREVADAAGVPKEIWNRDSRAGAISEGDEAGATVTDLQRMAGHTTAKMTGRYIRGAAIVTSQKVAQLRAAKRGGNGS